MTFREARESLQTAIFGPLRSLLGNLLSLVDELADWIYFRLDWWATPPTYEDDAHHIDYGKKKTRGEADHGKVRGDVAFAAALFMDIWLFVATSSITGIVALLAPISLLAYSFGDRAFMGFLKVLPQVVAGWRGQALAPGVTFEPHHWESGEPDAGLL